MSKTKKFFLAFFLSLACLFLLTCFSIIVVFVFKFENTSENIISTVYLFLYLIAVTFFIYYALKAYLTKPSVMNIIMIDERGQTIQKSKATTLILAIISAVFFAFSLAMLLGLRKVITIFSTGTIYAILDTSLGVGIVCLFFHFYPKFHENIQEK